MAKALNQFRGGTLVRGSTGEVAGEEDEGALEMCLEDGIPVDAIGVFPKPDDAAKVAAGILFHPFEAVAQPDVTSLGSILSPEAPGALVLDHDEARANDLLDGKLGNAKIIDDERKTDGVFAEFPDGILVRFPEIEEIEIGHLVTPPDREKVGEGGKIGIPGSDAFLQIEITHGVGSRGISQAIRGNDSR